MKTELNISAEKKQLQKELRHWFAQTKNHIDNIPKGFNKQVEHLSVIRKDIYEELNQLQHAAAIIAVAEKLGAHHKITKWCWHARQTSHPDEADLTGYCEDVVILNAEVTTSLKPIGSIDTRMGKTLASLHKKKGKKYYYVVTDEMYNRAITKKSKNNFNVIIEKF